MDLYPAFVLATTILMLVPGPNVALIVANSVAHGTRSGLATVAGTTSAMVVQLALAAVGLAAAMGTVAHVFEWIRWLGVVYLVYLGVSAWRAEPRDLTATPPGPASPRAIFARGFFVSLTNPKTLLFYGAFFPQFISERAGVGAQIALLSGTFLVVALAVDGTWAILAGRARHVLASRGRLRNRLTGGFFIGAGLGLALARRR